MTSVKEIKNKASKWLDENIDRFEGAIGVFLFGSLAYMDDDDDFPFFSDIDIKIVVEDVHKFERFKNKEEFKGLVVDWGIVDKEIFSSIDALLLNPYFGQQFLKNNILVDKNGFLGLCQSEVERRYNEPYYVKERCKKWVSILNGALVRNNAAEASERMTQIVILANRGYTTVRRLFEVTYDFLQAQNRLDLQEFFLENLGSKKFTKSMVLKDLDNLMYAFDFAAMSDNQPYILEDSYFYAHVRPYIYHGTLEMIEREHHRESVWWIFVNYKNVIGAMTNFPNNKTKYLIFMQFNDFMNRLGYRHGSDNIFVKQFNHEAVSHEISLYLQQPIFFSPKVQSII
jgi:predicted nucleotidyltransferase